MNVERIKFERTGGVVGMRLAAEFKLTELSEDQAGAIKSLLDDVDFADLPKEPSGDPSIPDEFTYTITVESERWQHTVVTGDSHADEKMQELLELLNRLARSRIRKN